MALTLAAALVLAACSEDTDADPATDATADAGPCLITDDQLGEILGTAQTVEAVDVPPVGDEPEGDLTCGTALDDSDREVTWTLTSAEMTVGGSLTHEELRSFVEGGDAEVSEVAVGADERAWLGTFSGLGQSRATTATSQGDQWLKVEVTGDDETLTVAEVGDQAVEVTQALVEALSSGPGA